MRNIMTTILAAIGLSLTSCATQENISSVDCETFEQAIVRRNVQLVDVRTAEEYAEGHIAYAVNIDVQQADFADKAGAKLSKKMPAYVYCRSGKRSLVAAEQLEKAGFKVINLDGGILEWTRQGKPVSD